RRHTRFSRDWSSDVCSSDLDWQKSYGGMNEDRASSIVETNDGGYIVAGYSKSGDGEVTGHQGQGIDANYWIVKLTSNGEIAWERSEERRVGKERRGRRGGEW